MRHKNHIPGLKLEHGNWIKRECHSQEKALMLKNVVDILQRVA